MHGRRLMNNSLKMLVELIDNPVCLKYKNEICVNLNVTLVVQNCQPKPTCHLNIFLNSSSVDTKLRKLTFLVSKKLAFNTTLSYYQNSDTIRDSHHHINST